MIGIFLSLCVAFLTSLSQLGGKIFTSTSKGKECLDEYTLAGGMRFFCFFLFLPFLFFLPFPEVLTRSFIGALFGSSIINTITTVTMLKAVKYGELSVVSPLSAMTIPFLFITTFFITGETVNFYGALGVLIIFLGSYLIHIELVNTGIFAPLKAIFLDKGARYMLLSSFLWSISSPLDKLGVQEVGALAWIVYTNIFVSLLFFILIFLLKKPFHIRKIFQKKEALKIGALALTTGLGSFLQMLALKYTLVIYVITLKRASGIFSIVLGYFFFQESRIPQKLIAASIMLVGVGIITILGNI